MSTLSNILEQGRRALQVQQIAMQVIGHNTSNAGTVGYSRRRLDLATAPPGATGQWGVGAGVDVNTLGRVRDRLLDAQISEGTSVSSYWASREDQLGRIEETFNALGDNNLGQMMDDFWQGWQDLANDPESMAPRYALRDKTNALVSSLKRVRGSLDDQLTEVNKQIEAAAGNVNQITTAIAELNVRIVQSEAGGQEASDLRDSRDLLVERLAGLTDIRTNELEDGSLNVYSGGNIIVQRDFAVQLQIEQVESDPKRNIVLTLGNGLQAWKSNSGELGALFHQRDVELPQVMDKLDQFARDFSSAVNAIHLQGFGMHGSQGQEFFSPDVTGVADLSLSESISNDVSMMAAASNDGSPGDNSLALQIAGIKNRTTESGQTLDEILRNVPIEVGSRRASAVQQRDVESAVLENATNRRFAISGVSLDEEMAKLIETQKAYEAAAKIVQTVDQMMDTVLNLKS